MRNRNIRRLAIGLSVAGLAVAGLFAVRGFAGPAPAAKAERISVAADILDSARSRLANECLARRGFTLPDEVAASGLDLREFPYGVDDVEWATSHGYGTDLMDQAERERKSSPRKLFLDGLPPARRAAILLAMNGAGPRSTSVTEARLPSGGVVRRSSDSCIAEAERELYGDLATWYRVERVTDNLPGVWVAEVLADPAYRSAIGAWATCMRGRGYRYDNPSKAHQDLRTAPGATREREIRTAVAEATCAHSSGLAATARGLEQRYAAAVRTKYAGEIETRRRLEDAAVPRACALLSQC